MNRPGNLGFVTDSPLFDEPQPGSQEYDLRQRAMAQQAMVAGRPLTVAEMHGGQAQQLFRTLGEDQIQRLLESRGVAPKPQASRVATGIIVVAGIVLLVLLPTFF